MRFHVVMVLLVLAVLACGDFIHAEEGILVIHVSNPKGQPLVGIVMSTMGDGSTGSPTDNAGKTRIRLAPGTKPNSEITLQIVRAPAPLDVVFISPWDRRVRVPSFENESQNVVSVVVAERGDRASLEYGQAVLAMASNINQANAPKTANEKPTEDQKQAALTDVAIKFGLEPEEIDKAIRELGKKTTSLYEKGMVALYEQNYTEATRLLGDSVKQLEQEEKDLQSRIVDATLFHAQSLYLEGKHREAAQEYEKAANRRPNDASILNSLALALHNAGEYGRAEPLAKQLLEMREKQLGPNHPDVALSLNNLAAILQTQAKYAEAESLYKRSLTIREKALGANHPDVAESLNNLAGLYCGAGKYADAEALYKRSLLILENALGLDHRDVAGSLNNLAAFYILQGRYAEATPLMKRASRIWERALGKDSIQLALGFNNLGAVYVQQVKYAEAESLFNRALIILELKLGKDHPTTALTLSNLAELYYRQSKYEESEQFYNRALSIKEKALGPGHPDLAAGLAGLADTYTAQSKYAKAEPLFNRALTIVEKNSSQDNPGLIAILEKYAVFLRKTNRLGEAAKAEARIKLIQAKQPKKNPSD